MKAKFYVAQIKVIRGIYLANFAWKLVVAFGMGIGPNPIAVIGALPEICLLTIIEIIHRQGYWNNNAAQAGLILSLAGITFFNLLETSYFWGPTDGLIFAIAPVWQAASIPAGFGTGWILAKVVK